MHFVFLFGAIIFSLDIAWISVRRTLMLVAIGTLRVNAFAPETPVTTCEDRRPFYHLQSPPF